MKKLAALALFAVALAVSPRAHAQAAGAAWNPAQGYVQYTGSGWTAPKPMLPVIQGGGSFISTNGHVNVGSSGLTAPVDSAFAANIAADAGVTAVVGSDALMTITFMSWTGTTVTQGIPLFTVTLGSAYSSTSFLPSCQLTGFSDAGTLTGTLGQLYARPVTSSTFKVYSTGTFTPFEYGTYQITCATEGINTLY